jgi:hypothetical protein
MEWSELDALADELRRTLARGNLRSIASTISDPAYGLTLELLARITLADIEHVREWDSTHPGHRTSESRLQELADDSQLLLGM